MWTFNRILRHWNPCLSTHIYFCGIVLDTEETENAMKDLIQFSRQEYDANEEELARIDEVEHDYPKNPAIWYVLLDNVFSLK